MPLMPKRVKYRKTQRGSRKGTASRNLRIDFGEFGLQTLERAWITNTQIEAARVALTRNMKRKGKLWIRIFPDKSVTARPPETRMGKGKGQPEYWVATVRPGNILFELDGVPESVARESLRLAADKLPVRTKFLTRHHVATSLTNNEIQRNSGTEHRGTRDDASATCGRRFFTCGCSSRAGSSKSRADCARLRRDVARIETVLTQRNQSRLRRRNSS